MIWIIKFLLLVCAVVCWGGDIVFVVGKDTNVEKLSRDDLRKIFLGEKIFIDGILAVPVNLPPNDPLRKEVEKRLLGMDREALELFWNRQYLEGIDPPVVLQSQKAVKMFVKRVRGAIGYIDESLLDDELKVVYRLKR